MKGGATLLLAHRVVDTQITVRVFRRYLTIKLPAHDLKFFLVPVFSRRYFKSFPRRILCLTTGFRNQCRSGKWKLKKKATFHIRRFMGYTEDSLSEDLSLLNS